MVCRPTSHPPPIFLFFFPPFFSRVWGDRNVIQMSKRPISRSPSRPLPHLSVFLCPFLVRRSYCSSGCSFIERDIAERGKKRKRWHAFSARCSASPARVACHLSDRGVTASTVEGTPLHHNGTDWAATDLSVCLSLRPVHQLSVTQTCLSIRTVPLFGLLSVSQPTGNCTVCIIISVCRSVLLFTRLQILQDRTTRGPWSSSEPFLCDPAFTHCITSHLSIHYMCGSDHLANQSAVKLSLWQPFDCCDISRQFTLLFP